MQTGALVLRLSSFACPTNHGPSLLLPRGPGGGWDPGPIRIGTHPLAYATLEVRGEARGEVPGSVEQVLARRGRQRAVPGVPQRQAPGLDRAALVPWARVGEGASLRGWARVGTTTASSGWKGGEGASLRRLVVFGLGFGSVVARAPFCNKPLVNGQSPAATLLSSLGSSTVASTVASS